MSTDTKPKTRTIDVSNLLSQVDFRREMNIVHDNQLRRMIASGEVDLVCFGPDNAYKFIDIAKHRAKLAKKSKG